MVMAWAAGRVKLTEMLRASATVRRFSWRDRNSSVGVSLSGQPLNADGAVAAVAMRLAANSQASLPFDHAFFLGILCNVLVCLAVWLAIGARTTSDKVLAILFPVSAFVVAGFRAFGREHVPHSARTIP